MKVIQSHSFPVEQPTGTIAKVVTGVALVSTVALAEDPAWYTALNTQLDWIFVAVGSVLGVVVGIRLAPLAWTHIKRVIHR